MTAAPWRFLGVPEDLDKSFERLVDTDILKQLDYSLSIFMRDSWLGLAPRQLSRDKNHELII